MDVRNRILGGYCGGVPPLPIPNREVKPTSADGTAMQCGRVGNRLLLEESSETKVLGLFFYAFFYGRQSSFFIVEHYALLLAQRKSTGDVFLFHSILYLCIMNMLEQLARLVLPKEILDNFDIVKIETDESDIDSMSMTIYLDERMNAYLQKSEDYESKGFMDAVRITDFPIRDHKVILVLRRRRWKNKETGETFVDRISVTESGTRYSKEFAAFLKETYGHIPDDLPYA